MNSSKLQSELHETLRKIGRNVLLFQRMEQMLKCLVANSNLEGTAKTLLSNHEKAKDAVASQTMGNLVKRMFTSIYQNNDNSDEEVSEANKAQLSMSFRIEADEASIEERRAALKQIVEERNLLIHQQLSQLNQSSIHSCRRLGTILDEQAERIKPEYEALRSLVIILRDGRKEALETLMDELIRSR